MVESYRPVNVEAQIFGQNCSFFQNAPTGFCLCGSYCDEANASLYTSPIFAL
jgi:hypothetical protein